MAKNTGEWETGHLRSLPRCEICSAPATQELRNDRNAPQGRYCDRHAAGALRRFRERAAARAS